MKRLAFYILLSFALAACGQEFIGQYPVDSEAPSKVSNARVENFAGRVTITYDLPSDTDLLYVKAVYTDSHGEKAEVRASNFKNKLELKGFAKSAVQYVELISVDRSQNESEPLKVQIEPLDSPIYSIMESVKVTPSWGGFKIVWENPDAEQIFMYITTPGEEGDELIQTIITTETSGNGAVRGLDAVEKEFDVVIRDIYENYTDTIRTVLTPLYEKFITPDAFELTALATGMTWSKRNNVGALFDGVTGSDKPIYIETKASKDGAPYSYFTIDLGSTYQLSRFKFWGRVKYCYALHCPKHFQLWGSMDENVLTNPDSFEGWSLIMDDWSYKPSGSDNADVTAEDQEYAKAGEEYEIPESAQPLRYCRFVCLETWTKSKALNINEMEFYGAEYSVK